MSPLHHLTPMDISVKKNYHRKRKYIWMNAELLSLVRSEVVDFISSVINELLNARQYDSSGASAKCLNLKLFEEVFFI